MGLSKNDIDIIKSTVPLLEQSGESITERMYVILFSRYPQVKPMFEGAESSQHKKLASMVLAFAKNVDNLEVLLKPIGKVAHIHVDKNVQPEHYSLVGECLLQAIMDVTDEGADSPVIEAWGRGYTTVADILIGQEKIIRETIEKVA